MSTVQDPNPSSWTKAIPWFLTIASVLALIAIGVFLVSNIQWYKETVLDSNIIDVNVGGYRMRAYDLHLSMIKRSVGLFSGFTIMFLGLGVAFYTLSSNTELGASVQEFKFNLLTASPGIVAIIVGGLLIILTINSKDTFYPYEAQYQAQDESTQASETSESEQEAKGKAIKDMDLSRDTIPQSQTKN